MFNWDTIFLVFIAMTLAVSQGFQPWQMLLKIAPNASALANSETSLSIRQQLTLFPRFVKAHEQFFHFNPDKHQSAETEAN